MKTRSTNQTRQSAVGRFLVPILLALIFLAFTFAFYPFREKLQFDSDEGLNLMRSMLVTLGHPLYSEVSSDQPPLFTQMLALLFRLVGFEVNPARFLVLLFAALVVWSGAQFLEITWGHLAAILFLPLAIMLPQYLRLSTSVMIGMPSIALAAVSMVFVAFWHRQHRNLWLGLSGFALALSVLIKLFTGLLAPILFGEAGRAILLESPAACHAVELVLWGTGPGTWARAGWSPECMVDHLPACSSADHGLAAGRRVHNKQPAARCCADP
jgi:4-amino-4-deoxy-L-arabinose transferase-like glycosyltransferase